MFKLIRDKVPELAKKEKQVINYATAENEELYVALLKSKFAEDASDFLNTGDVTKLADVLTILKTIVKTAGISEEDFDKIYQERLKTDGGFEKRYIGFFPDEQPAPVAQQASETATK